MGYATTHTCTEKAVDVLPSPPVKSSTKTPPTISSAPLLHFSASLRPSPSLLQPLRLLVSELLRDPTDGRAFAF